MAHPGFKKVQASIAKREGIGKERAGAILAAATRRSSRAAKRKNPRLKRVKGYTGPSIDAAFSGDTMNDVSKTEFALGRALRDKAKTMK